MLTEQVLTTYVQGGRQVFTQKLKVRAASTKSTLFISCKYIYLPVFQMLSFNLSNLAAGKIKYFLTQ